MKNNKFLGFLILSLIMTSCNLFNDKEADTETSNSDTDIVTQREIQIRACTDKEIADMIKDSILAGKLRTATGTDQISIVEMNKIVAFRYADEMREVRQFMDPNFITTKTNIKKPGGGGIAWHNQSNTPNTNKEYIVFSTSPIANPIKYPLTDKNGKNLLIIRNNDAQCLLAPCNNFKTYPISIIEKP